MVVWSVLTIRKHAGLPVFQDLVELLTELLVAWVAEQVILPAFGETMLQTHKNTLLKMPNTYKL